jgi:hypothetical protein
MNNGTVYLVWAISYTSKMFMKYTTIVNFLKNLKSLVSYNFRIMKTFSLNYLKRSSLQKKCLHQKFLRYQLLLLNTFYFYYNCALQHSPKQNKNYHRDKSETPK